MYLFNIRMIFFRLDTILFQAMTGIYLLTYIMGYEFWKITPFGFSCAEIFEIVMYSKYGKIYCMRVCLHACIAVQQFQS